MLKISSISADRRIFISCNDYYEPNEYVEFVKSYQRKLSGKIFAVSKDCQHGIDNDPYKLIFQWDDLFGITVVVPIEADINEVASMLEKLCDEINLVN